MATLPPVSSFRHLPSSSLAIHVLPRTLYHQSSKIKPFHYPLLSTHLSRPSLLSDSAFAAASSFPYSQFQYRHHPNYEGPDKERGGVSKEAQQEDDDDILIGDCLVFEEGAFEDANPFLSDQPKRRKKRISDPAESSYGNSNSLIPDKWKEVAAEINLTKKEKRKIAHQLRFGSRLEARKKTPVPDMEEYLTYRDMKLSQLNPVVLDNPKRFPRDAAAPKESDERSSGRVAPRNPRLGIYGETLENITEFFNSGDYVPGERNDDKKPQGRRRKLFTEEEKALLNRRIPNLAEATSRKWLPLHALASSGEFYLMNLLLKHNVDINAVDKDGLTAIHKAILSKKLAITSYLLRNSANPFVLDMDGGTLLHYAVHTASSESIKLLLLYNVDINLADNDGWTPLHLAVQTQRTDIVRLLLKKGANRTIKNQAWNRQPQCLHNDKQLNKI